MAYDSTNIFARILRGEIPCKKVFENEHALAFYDITPQAPVHVLVLPKGPYVAYEDFALHASEAEVMAFSKAIAEVVSLTKIGEAGYRLITNSGSNSGQEVPHYHVHVLGGRGLGPILSAL